MMDGLLQGLVTVFAFATFLGICVYAYSPSRKSTFEEAAQLPLDDSESES
ncbi:MAG: cbb3-type cytochrome c oxidase subunit 3 [Gammaproteobacteria bacterium]|nr:cbb3-type cytochrome c oxidase subunit 3 [Gammaproteobacteria bacterium]